MKNQIATIGITSIIVAAISVAITLFYVSPSSAPLDQYIVEVDDAKVFTDEYQRAFPNNIKAYRISDDLIDKLWLAKELRGNGESMRSYFAMSPGSQDFDFVVIVPTKNDTDKPFVYQGQESVYKIPADPKRTDLCPRICDANSPFYLNPSPPPNENEDVPDDSADDSSNGTENDLEENPE